jgi:hypothetical protein
MKSLPIVASIIAAFTISSCQNKSKPSEHPKFEYSAIQEGPLVGSVSSESSDPLTKALNEKGSQGWELILVDRSGLDSFPKGTAPRITYIFKRQLAEQGAAANP